MDGVFLIVIYKVRYYKRKDGLVLGFGLFVIVLEYVIDIKVIVVGKLEKIFFLEVLWGIGCEFEEVVMIGDDCRDDVGGV